MTLSDLWPGFQSNASFEVEYLKTARLKDKVTKVCLTYGIPLCLVTLTDL